MRPQIDMKSLRQKLGMTQEALARRLGVSYGTVRGWEYGRQPSPMAREKIDQLLKELGEGKEEEENRNKKN